MGDGVIGQTTENVHIPAVVVYSSKREPALIHHHKMEAQLVREKVRDIGEYVIQRLVLKEH